MILKICSFCVNNRSTAVKYAYNYLHQLKTIHKKILGFSFLNFNSIPVE